MAHVALSRLGTGSPAPDVHEVAVPGAVRAIARTLLGAAVAVAVATSLFGGSDISVNPGARLLWSVLPAGVLVAVLVLGPSARRLNPLRTLSRLAVDPEPPDEAVLARTAIVALCTLVLARMLFGDDPAFGGIAATLYLFGTAAAGAIFGERWFDRGDPVDVATATLGSTRSMRYAPAADHAATLGIVAVLVGDAVTQSLADTGPLSGVTGSLALTAALLGTVFLVAALAWFAAPDRSLRPALVPIAASYVAAHAAAPLISEVQIVALQTLSAFGANVLVEPIEFREPEVLAVVVALALLAGHVRALVVARHISRMLQPSRARVLLPQFAAVTGLSLFTALAVILPG